MNAAVSKQKTPILERADGVTEAERYLAKLCDRSFLSLWSYPNVYRDQGRRGTASDGKEVCDLLVVFENDVIIFSDKDCRFPTSGDLNVDWCRWFKRAVKEPAEQIWGAERWIRSHSDRLYLDPKCTRPFPIELPNPKVARVHRIVVAHGGVRRCREELGGSGSLMLLPSIVGSAHTNPSEGGRPFAIGQLDPARGYVHVFDDASLKVVMNTLDTVADFTAYLTKKELLILSGEFAGAAGEEELLAFYLKNLDRQGDHDFIWPKSSGSLVVVEGLWEDFTQRSERLAQVKANKISYAWDALIENFTGHVLAGTQHFTTHPGYENLANQEKIFRFMARESRTRRRMLASGLLGIVRNTPKNMRFIRVILPSHLGDPYYVFLLLPHLDGIDYEEYREVRRNFLAACCKVTRLNCPQAEDIIGIATESGRGAGGSEDIVWFDGRDWTTTDEKEALSLQSDLNILTNVTKSYGTEKEYPEASDSDVITISANYPRTRPCPCGSGKKYKRCHAMKDFGSRF